MYRSVVNISTFILFSTDSLISSLLLLTALLLSNTKWQGKKLTNYGAQSKNACYNTNVLTAQNSYVTHKEKSYKLRSLTHSLKDSLYDLMIIYFPKVKWQPFKKFFFLLSLWKTKSKKSKTLKMWKISGLCNSISIYFYLCSAKSIQQSPKDTCMVT